MQGNTTHATLGVAGLLHPRTLDKMMGDPQIAITLVKDLLEGLTPYRSFITILPENISR